MEIYGFSKRHYCYYQLVVPQAPINEGQYVEQILSAYSVISSDKPILVAQYSNGTTFDGVTSDPFMMLVPPYEQFLAN
ncbi:MAG: IgGFc-binding protein [Ignavibacteria bacterium]|nr:IgGFc-binding protein [Ignavibacteria bacterium]